MLSFFVKMKIGRALLELYVLVALKVLHPRILRFEFSKLCLFRSSFFASTSREIAHLPLRTRRATRADSLAGKGR